MALAKGLSRVRCGPLTMHTETAIDIAQKLCQVIFVLAKILLLDILNIQMYFLAAFKVCKFFKKSLHHVYVIAKINLFSLLAT